MDPKLETALLLMLVGMLTVFAVLALLVASGRTLIRIVNHFSVERRTGRTGAVASRSRGISGPELAAISAAVMMVTEGKGRIEHIERIS